MARPGDFDRGGQAKFSYKVFARVLSYMKGYRWALFLALLFLALRSVFIVLGDVQLRPLINRLGAGGGLADLSKPLFWMALAYGLNALSAYLGKILSTYASQHVTRKIRKDLFEKTQGLPMRFFDQRTHGELLSRYTSDVESVTDLLEEALGTLSRSLSAVVSTFVAMLLLSPILTLVVVVNLLLMGLVIKVVGRYTSAAYRKRQADIASLNGYVEEMISGQRVVKAFAREAVNLQVFEGMNQTLQASATKAGAWGSVIQPVTISLGYLQFAVIAMVGSLMAIQQLHGMDLGTLTAFLEFSRKFNQPLVNLSMEYNAILRALAGAERVFAVLDEPEEIDDGVIDQLHVGGKSYWRIPKDALSQVNGEGLVLHDLPEGAVGVLQCGHIVLEDCRFGYEEGQQVLKGIRLHAKPRQKIALVGATGAGKTTIANLLTRFYELDGGRILLDGIDIRQIKKSALRQAIGMVLQDVQLFQGTVRENIAYGSLANGSTPAVISVEEAARISYAQPFIGTLAEGLETPLQMDGSNLAEGQRQLLSIARAAKHNPLILVLDEATSSVDTRTERLVELGMDQLMADRTTLVIAHRLSTVRHADAILILEDGQIIERGNHEELMAMKGRYYDLHQGVIRLA